MYKEWRRILKEDPEFPFGHIDFEKPTNNLTKVSSRQSDNSVWSQEKGRSNTGIQKSSSVSR